MTLFAEILFLGLILSADSFSAALAMGSRPFTSGDALKFALTSGGAEAFTCFVGFWAGANIIKVIAEYDHWVAFGILALVALHMLKEGYDGLKKAGHGEEPEDFHKFWKVILVSFATSLDAFGVGLSLGIANKPIGPFVASIGVWAFVTTLIGLYLARQLSNKMGPIFTLIAAAILGTMSIQMLSI